MASSVLNRTPLTLPFLSLERLLSAMPTRSANLPSGIFR